MTADRVPDSTSDSGDGCAACGAPTPARPGGTQLVAGKVVVREIGSCRSCGLQLVRFVGEPWREIRG